MAALELEKRGFRGTFWVCGALVNEDINNITDTTRVNWSELQEMSIKGHEISNHTWSHKKLTKISLEEVKTEIVKNDSIIFEKIGKMPFTFCYPYNSQNDEIYEIASKNRVATRTQQYAIGSKSTAERLDTWVASLMKFKYWGVGMLHGITYGYDSFENPQIFWHHLDKVKALEDKIWVGTFLEVSSYLVEKENVELKVVKKKKGLEIIPSLNLDKELYKEPLTMVIENKSVNKVTVKQDKKKLSVQIYSNKIIFDFDPYGGSIQVNMLY